MKIPTTHTPSLLPLIRILPILYLILLSQPLISQKNPPDNLVPNPGFEEYSDEPSGWYYSGKDFSRVAMFWTSPTAASPDIYGPSVKIPVTWQSNGFGKVSAYAGKSFAGITVYGCGSGKPHCREYVQVQLTEPLVPGQRYGFSCMVAHLQKSVLVRNIGLWFSDYEIDEGTHDPILQTPVLSVDRFLPSDGKWYRWTGQFVAETSSSYLLIGNFNNDENSQIKMPVRSDLRFGYYYLDEVRLFKIPPVIIPPKIESPLTNFVPKPGEIVTLSRIYFEHDRTDFMPRALIQLDQLLAFMKKYPKMTVEIIGHTDSVGSMDYNQNLSQRRSIAVINWLVKKGIEKGRMTAVGYGSTQPVASNATSQGRSQNRRVEIKVISI
jgi:outer membrane protein OmpA-like peptidoglycan-associated protein